MELRKFISEALKDILGGIADAQGEISGGEIISKTSSAFKGVEAGITNIQPIDFEVAAIVDEAKGGAAKLSVVAALVGGSVSGNSSAASSHSAKLSLRVPVRFRKRMMSNKQNYHIKSYAATPWADYARR